MSTFRVVMVCCRLSLATASHPKQGQEQMLAVSLVQDESFLAASL
jgi:hypothetical protein